MDADDEGTDNLLQPGEGAEPQSSVRGYATPLQHWWDRPLLADHQSGACRQHVAEQTETHVQTPTLFKDMTEAMF